MVGHFLAVGFLTYKTGTNINAQNVGSFQIIKIFILQVIYLSLNNVPLHMLAVPREPAFT